MIFKYFQACHENVQHLKEVKAQFKEINETLSSIQTYVSTIMECLGIKAPCLPQEDHQFI